jgi:hypothetical protein
MGNPNYIPVANSKDLGESQEFKYDLTQLFTQ